MKNKIIFFFLGAIFVLSIFWIKRTIYLIGNSDPDFNTIYSSKYKEYLFNEDLIGKTENEINELLGTPLYKNQVPFFNSLLYTRNKSTTFLNTLFDCVQFKNSEVPKQYRYFILDSIGKIKNIKIVGLNERGIEYSNLNKTEILEKLGLPDAEIYKPSCEILSYSNLTKGVQSGKRETINIRRVIFNKNKIAIEIIKEIGGGTYVCSNCDCK